MEKVFLENQYRTKLEPIQGNCIGDKGWAGRDLGKGNPFHVLW